MLPECSKRDCNIIADIMFTGTVLTLCVTNVLYKSLGSVIYTFCTLIIKMEVSVQSHIPSVIHPSSRYSLLIRIQVSRTAI